MDILKSFIIGSSWPISLIYLIENSVTSNLFIPPFFGLMNCISLFIGATFKISLQARLFVISVISPIIIITYSKIFKIYNYTEIEWAKYYTKTFFIHMIIWNFLVHILEILV